MSIQVSNEQKVQRRGEESRPRIQKQKKQERLLRKIFVIHNDLMTAAAAAKSLQSCPTLCDPRDGSPPGFPIPGILQARVLEWGAIAFSGSND